MKSLALTALSTAVLFTPWAASSRAPNFAKTTLPFGCEVRVGATEADLTLMLVVDENAVKVYQGEVKIDGYVLLARITTEPKQPHQAVDFVVEYGQNPGGGHKVRYAVSAALSPVMGIDDQGTIMKWNEAYVKLTLLEQSQLSMACFSKPTTTSPADTKTPNS